MLKYALFVTLEAKPGKETEVESFLKGALPMVEEELETTVWFALRLSPSVFGIFDAFPNEAGRQAHMTGKVAEALFQRSPDLFSKEPKIEKIEVLADKVPGFLRSADLPPEAFAP